MNIQQAEEYILGRLRNELAENLHYHCYEHTLDVVKAAMEVAHSEGIGERELLLLQTAALFHDSGFMETYRDHEEKGCEIARAVLPGFDYSGEEIDSICDLIMATKVPQEPTTKLERIICDADLDYLGTDDFRPIGARLFLELKEQGILETEEQWNRLQLGFLSKHHYFTDFSKRNREPKKQENLESIRALVAAYGPEDHPKS